MPQRTPVEHGVLDYRLGISNKNKRCGTCGQQLKECAGHFGFVKLPLPVFHQVWPNNSCDLYIPSSQYLRKQWCMQLVICPKCQTINLNGVANLPIEFLYVVCFTLSAGLLCFVVWAKETYHTEDVVNVCLWDTGVLHHHPEDSAVHLQDLW